MDSVVALQACDGNERDLELASFPIEETSGAAKTRSMSGRLPGAASIVERRGFDG